MVSTIVHTVTPTANPQAHSVVPTTERPVGGTLESRAFFLIFIRVIPTIILPIALPGQRFAERVIALELIQRTGPHHRSAIVLIAAVHTVRIIVTMPAVRDAMSVLALELVNLTSYCTVLLVRTISAIVVPVALPSTCDTSPIGTRKLTLRARPGSAAFLVRIVPTIVVVVTFPAPRDTSIVLATELVRFTGPLITLLLWFI